MDLMDPKLWLEIAKWVVILVIGWSTYMRKPGEEAARAVEQLETDMLHETNGIKNRLTAVEGEIKHMPRNEDVARLAGQIETVGVRVEGIESRLEGVGHQLNRIENYLLNQK